MGGRAGGRRAGFCRALWLGALFAFGRRRVSAIGADPCDLAWTLTSRCNVPAPTASF